MKFSYMSLVLGVLLSISFVQAQEKKSEPLILKHSDQLETNLSEENLITVLTGNVWFEHGNLTLKSEQAVWYKTAGQVVFSGNVSGREEGRILYADKVIYYQNSKTVVADGNVRLEDSSETVSSARKEVSIITGKHGEYQRDKKYIIFTGTPELVKNPGQGDTTVTVVARKMEYFVEEKKGKATEAVKITKAKVEATCDQAEYFTQQDKIILTGNPAVKQEKSQLTGEKLEIFLKENKIEKLIVDGGAKATYSQLQDSIHQAYSKSFLAGNQIQFFLEDEKLNVVQVTGNASSNYFPAASDTQWSGKNQASGDTIRLYLTEGEVKKVLIEGGAQGNYYIPKSPTDTLYSDTVKYSSNSITYEIDKNLITLSGNAQLDYQKTSLTSGRIEYDTQKSILKAQGLEIAENGKKKWSELPLLRDGTDEIAGYHMTYNLKTEKGEIKAGSTEFEGGFYHGERLRKVEENVFLASRGTYTTCDKNEPHFHFYSTQMKIINKDKVIARPVVLYIRDLPVAAIPFYVFPIKPGRHSGFLTLDIGNFEEGDRFVKNIGYYWAASEYWDLEAAFDFYEKSGWVIKGIANYALRYNFTGSVAGSIRRQSIGDIFSQRSNTRWDLVLQHSQTLSPTASISGYGNFASDRDYYRQISLDPIERRNRTLVSRINYTQRFSNISMNVALDQSWNLDTEDKRLLIPTLRITKPSAVLFGSAKDKKTENKWYQSIYYSYSSVWQNLRNKFRADSLSFNEKKFATALHSTQLKFSHKFLSILSLSPVLNYQEAWYYVFPTDVSDSLNLGDNKFVRRGIYDLALEAQTNLYGTFPFRIWSWIGARHILTPSLSFSYRPTFTQNSEYVTYTGVGAAGNSVKALNFGLGNVFLIKIRQKEQEKKVQLFLLNFNSGYNFNAPQKKLAPLSTVLRSNAISGVDFAFTMQHDFYDPVSLELSHPRLINFTLDTDLNFQGQSGEESISEETAESGLETYPEKTGAATRPSVWNVGISHRYSENRTSLGTLKNHWMNFQSSFNLTPNWHISYTNRYDFIEKKISDQIFDIYRDLHCWEASFRWIPNGFRKGFYFRINIKALPEIKFEKSQGGLRSSLF